MTIVKVSKKFEVKIPLEIHRSLGIKPGQQLQVLQYLDRIEYIPLERARAMRGFLRGIDTTLLRDEDRA